MKRFLAPLIVFFAAMALAVSCASSPPPAQPAPQPQAAQPLPPGKPAQADTAGPSLRVTFSPKYFSPNGDKDELAIYLVAVDESPLGSWKVEIHEPEPPYPLFYQWEGKGKPPEMLKWNGKSTAGELVQSAMDYPFVFTASDVPGNTSTLKSFIEVDVFVISDGKNLRIQIPSVVFDSNSGNWDNLSTEVIAKNDWILKRIAQILNKFPGYQVRVEGHANPTVDPRDKAASQLEETRELLPLSEIRAMAIVDYLVKQGVDPKRLSSYGMGGERPVAAWTDKDNWWKNRRVEFLLIKP
ncbi:MAG: OmpA family protein [Treponema sp.]|nr:OmpA family protein [Treponema sp.]